MIVTTTNNLSAYGAPTQYVDANGRRLAFRSIAEACRYTAMSPELKCGDAEIEYETVGPNRSHGYAIK